MVLTLNKLLLLAFICYTEELWEQISVAATPGWRL